MQTPRRKRVDSERCGRGCAQAQKGSCLFGAWRLGASIGRTAGNKEHRCTGRVPPLEHGIRALLHLSHRVWGWGEGGVLASCGGSADIWRGECEGEGSPTPEKGYIHLWSERETEYALVMIWVVRCVCYCGAMVFVVRGGGIQMSTDTSGTRLQFGI